ncbi:related to multidrug resistant protein [Rhynchosporium secalis]|uniref:Related to multidrug resistant protein n=1 Tax=Rhynchosporium secalis TaxID=38038 RepID=A0A1E1LZH3_RHYSE|nr:related to multidrug resistant protein [Rhynchosporium secalis]
MPASKEISSSDEEPRMRSSVDPEKDIGGSNDTHEVTWAGNDDPQHPMNWSLRRKLSMTILISFGGLVSLMSTSMLAPALLNIENDLHTGDSETNLILSIYVLALAFGPLFISPLSELFGRKKVYLLCHVWYILWNAVAPVGKMKALLIVGRFLSGLGASVGLALPGPMMADIWKPAQRGKTYALVTFTPLLGVAVGPIIGGIVAENIGWPWIFWIVSASDGFLVVLGFFLIYESYAPTLLAKKARDLRKESGEGYFTKHELSHPKLSQKLKVTMVRPVRMLFSQPLVPLISMFLAYEFGVYCLAITTFGAIFEELYHQSTTISGLHYTAIAVGNTIGSQMGGWATDRVWKHLTAKAGGSTSPEYRVPMMIPGAIAMPIGLFWYGWSVQERLLWIMPDIGIAIFSGGATLATQAVIQYTVEAFGDHSASAVAAVRFLSNIFGFAFPLFAPKLYDRLDYGWGNSLLAFLFIAFAVPGPFLLWKFGGRIRAVGKEVQ